MDPKECDVCVTENECYSQSVILYEESRANIAFNLQGIRIEKSFALLQKPSEDLRLSLKIFYKSSASEYTLKYKYSFDLSLNFINNIHLLGCEYSYQLVFRVKTMHGKHIYLFSVDELRKDSRIAIQDMFYVNVYTNILHICCDIKRFNRSKANISKAVSRKDDIVKILLETGLYSDISLVVGEDIIQTHRHILMSRSKVFEVMFSNDMFEKENGMVKIDDFSTSVVKEMLSYIYTGESTILSENCYELFQIAHKYQIKDLQSECEEYFLFNVDLDNVVSILDLTLLYDLYFLKTRLLKFVNKNESQMIKKPTYQEFLCRNLTMNTIVDVLKMCHKYEIPSVKEKAFQFVKANIKDLVKNKQYLDLFDDHSSLMKEIVVYVAS